ncbi:hypothetical protein R6Q57_014063 [Mikania cordata]
MGCASSKQSICQNCHAQYSPVRMSYSSLPNRSPLRETDDHHVVTLASTTLGYLLLDPSINQLHPQPVRRNVPQKNTKDFELELIEAKTWSKRFDEKIKNIAPITPIVSPSCEPEAINAWELMEGLDDSSPLQPPSMAFARCLLNKNSDSITLDQPPTPTNNSNTNDTSIASSFDPNKINIKPMIKEGQQSLDCNGDNATNSLPNIENRIVSCSKEKLILYYTSLRGVRKTYEDCCHVRVILKNSGARVDERDVSMHSGFKEELKELLGDGYSGGDLPKVFVGKKCIGGVDEIRRFHDECKLDKVLEGCETVDDGDGCGGCEGCGDIRFLPCETCSGSCKVYYEVNSDVEEDEIGKNDCGFQRCTDCNENGLIRCPICCN